MLNGFMRVGSGRLVLGLALGLICGAAVGGCASTQSGSADRGGSAASESSKVQVLEQGARSVVIRRGDGTGVLSWDEVAGEMARADVVLFGEMHGHALGNAVAQELWEEILTRKPQAILSMEFYERDQQVAINDYLSGVTDREGFEKASNRNTGNNPVWHERMIEAAKEAQRPVLASNAPRRYVKMARKEGYERLSGLGETQRALFDVPDGIPQGAYKDRFVEAMGSMASHGGEEMINGFLRSQSVWDATMGQTIVDGLELGSPVAHVVGYFHVQFGAEEGGSGLIDEVRSRAQSQLGRDVKIVTLITLARDDQEIHEEDVGIAEFVVYVGADEDE
jgi:uncharacterized iron-regulated protein